ncbi:translation elongation factor Ts [bacterium]|nr:translation elongation factor Ts [bacterium]
MAIDVSSVKELRERTGAGMMECKKALTEAGGDMEAAIKRLRETGAVKAAARAHRQTREGAVVSYIHTGGKLGALVEVNCETDFVARTDDFLAFCKNLAMHVAATNPRVIERSELRPEDLAEERAIYEKQAEGSGKPAAVVEKIVAGKLDKYMAEVSLLEQPFVKDQNRSVADVLNEVRAKTGENIVIRRFVRFCIGE